MNSWYTKGRQRFATAGVNWPTDTIRVSLIDLADYTVNLATHEFYSSVPAAAIVSNVALASKTATDGVLDAADAVLPNVTGDQSEALIIWRDTGVASTSPLLLYIDTASGLPVTPNGASVTILWNTAGIARL